MKWSIAWGSHMTVLIKALSLTDGPVLELGGGVYSTPLLHWMCQDQNRRLVTYDNIPEYFDIIKSYASPTHSVTLIDNWDKINIEQPWGVALVDHWPAGRRVTDIRRLAPWAKYIVVHDTEKSQSHHYHYEEIYPLFKYHFKYRKVKPHTSILSNIPI